MTSRQSTAWLRALVACVALASAMWSGDALAQNIVFSGDAKDKVYGSALCQSNSAINVSWVFTPQSAFTIGTNVTFKVIVGGETEDTGVKIKTFTVTPAGVTTNYPSGSAEARLESSTSGISKSASKGMFADPIYLTIRDMIGFSKVAEDPNAQPTVDNVCDLSAPNDDAGATVVRLCIRAEYNIQETQAGGGVQNVSKDHTGCLDVQFDLTPPKAPTGLSLAPSEKQIIATWTFLQDHKYDIFVSKTAFSPDNQKQIVPTPINGATQVLSSPYTVQNLTEQTEYYVAIRATDPAGNQGAISEVLTASTVELTDFYEAYNNAGGKDKGFNGGFCFIATAAYGTYDHRYVKILRDFRDQHLMTNGPGRAFVAWYYHNSPSWADWIRQHPNARRAVQVMLFPLIAAAAFFVRLSLGAQLVLVLLFLGLLLLIRHRRKVKAAAPVALLLLGVGMISTHSSEAQAATPRNFGMEIRAGIYQPQIDQESGLNGTPYKSIFGDPLQFYIETHFEWLVFKKYGSIGIGGSVGFTWAEGKALNSAGTTNSSTDGDDASSNATGLWIIPLRLDVSYRMDYFAVNHNFPLVPYIRGGMDYYLWLVTDPSGNIARDSNDNSAFGGRLGFHFGLGVQFLLDIFDRRAALTFDNELGVNHTYLFFEWNFSWVGILTPGLNLSDSSFRAGLLFQF